MREITVVTKVYKFEELSDKGKEKALENLWDLNVDYEWWEGVYEDAAQIEMDITEFDLDQKRYCNAKIPLPLETARLILENHGETCDTYKLAKEFLNGVEKAESSAQNCFFEVYDEYKLEGEIEDLEATFKKVLCKEYASMLQKEYEYLTSKEGILESIESNDYDFTEDGEIF